MTDPLLLDAVEQELRQMRDAGSLRVIPSPAGRAWPAPHGEIDEIPGAVAPRPAPLGTRMPMEFDAAPGPGHAAEDPSASYGSVVQFTGEQRLLPVREPDPVQSAQAPRRPVVAAPASMPIGPEPIVASSPGARPVARARPTRDGSGGPAAPERTRTSLVFWIVVGAATIAVLTVVALLPF